MRRISNVLVILAVTGLAVAVLRAFNWDPFAVAEWAFHHVWNTIDGAANLWSDNDTFREVTEPPK